MSKVSLELEGNDGYIELKASISERDINLDFIIDGKAVAASYDLDDAIAVRDWLTFTINECKRAVES